MQNAFICHVRDGDQLLNAYIIRAFNTRERERCNAISLTYNGVPSDETYLFLMSFIGFQI